MLRITNTEYGMVAGQPGTDARITVFKGIPFAANTSGENRWRPPQKPKSWDGIRHCDSFAPITMQKTPGENPKAFYSKEWHVDPEVPMSEDGSLVVNIWTPAKTGKEKMPVMVWIFGGGLQEGYAHEMEFDGERIAARGVVFVSVAYRLNVFGFLAHPDLTAENLEAPTNFGFLDQKAGIEWVKRNIENFGGDPENITIMGQSAGGVSVFSHMCSPQTGGMFQRAIIQSSAGGSLLPVYPKTRFAPAPTLKEAEAQGVRFLEEYLGVHTIEEARKLDAAFIRDKCVESGLWFAQVTDGKFMVESITEGVLLGHTHPIQLLIGYTEDEMLQGVAEGTDEQVRAWIDENFGPYAEEYLQACRERAERLQIPLGEASLVNSNENSTRIAAYALSRQGRKVYAYAFDPTIPGDDAGSFHSSDLWFSFETLMKCWRPFNGHHYDLARQMCNYWTNFARTGDPNGLDSDGKPMVQWSPFTEKSPLVLHLYDEIAMEKPEEADKKREVMLRSNQEAYTAQMGGK